MRNPDHTLCSVLDAAERATLEALRAPPRHARASPRNPPATRPRTPQSEPGAASEATTEIDQTDDRVILRERATRPIRTQEIRRP